MPDVKQLVQEKYGEAARRVGTGGSACCGTSSAASGCCDPGVGFERLEIEPTRVYNIEDARAFLSGQGVDVDAMGPQVEGTFMSAFVRATTPAACCGPHCCAS